MTIRLQMQVKITDESKSSRAAPSLLMVHVTGWRVRVWPVRPSTWPPVEVDLMLRGSVEALVPLPVLLPQPSPEKLSVFHVFAETG